MIARHFCYYPGMDVSDILENLNDAQRDAVCSPPGNMLVLAGAGSGKTRVLVHRIAWLIRAEHVSPYAILAVTFTNKAAREMRSRIEALLGVSPGGMWVGTFHGLAHRLLRAHWQEAELPQAFQILDSDDQYRLIRRILRELQLDEANWPPRQVQGFINARKDEGLRPQHIEHYDDLHQKTLLRVYQRYEEACQRGGLVDFAELLLRAHELWLKRPDVLQIYRERFQHILVDEFQDTNAIQYAWIRLLAGESGHVFVVGDDDQSIYGWRGARVENIHQFRKDLHNVRLIRLEQNYRSTGTILAAANALIDNNADRLGKELWTEGAEGEPIRLYSAFNELEEARFIVERIDEWQAKGGGRSEVALLYRSNAQSRVLEEALMRADIPYRVYGGMRFFERAEIKDALAYLRLVANRDDDPSFERVVNTPTRGIGDRTVQAVRERARSHVLSMWQAARQIVAEKGLPARAMNALNAFLDLIERVAADCQGVELHEQTEQVIESSGLLDHFRKEKGEKGRTRIENLEELVNAARQFEFDEEDEWAGEPIRTPDGRLEEAGHMDVPREHGDMDPLTAFLAHASLEAGEGQAEEWEDCVQLMTLHSAKGLEFPLVFLCGMEEGLFPHRMSMDEPGRLEEERRLCYVGMTRAMQQLYLTSAEVRRLYGKENYTRPSRFIREIPSQYVEEIRMGGVISQPSHAYTSKAKVASEGGLQLGAHVLHPKFGNGVVLNCEGQGAQARVQVNFDAVGTKWLVLAYANLQMI
jgi:DNA helicase-2/ATP-dependent DNA helicase PcrA